MSPGTTPIGDANNVKAMTLFPQEKTQKNEISTRDVVVGSTTTMEGGDVVQINNRNFDGIDPLTSFLQMNNELYSSLGGVEEEEENGWCKERRRKGCGGKGGDEFYGAESSTWVEDGSRNGSNDDEEERLAFVNRPWSSDCAIIRRKFRKRKLPTLPHHLPGTSPASTAVPSTVAITTSSNHQNQQQLHIEQRSLIQDRICNLRHQFNQSWCHQQNRTDSLRLVNKAIRYLSTSANGITERSILGEVEWTNMYPIVYLDVVELLDDFACKVEGRIKYTDDGQPSYDSHVEVTKYDTTSSHELFSVSIAEEDSDTIIHPISGSSESVPLHGWEFDPTSLPISTCSIDSQADGGGTATQQERSTTATTMSGNNSLIMQEICKEWSDRVNLIRDLLPRFYVTVTLLDTFYKYMHPTQEEKLRYLKETLTRLVSTVRGIGDPLVSVYARAYLSRWCQCFYQAQMLKQGEVVVRTAVVRTSESDNHDDGRIFDIVHETAVSLLSDFLRTYPTIQTPRVQSKLRRIDVTTKELERVQSPAVSWLVRSVAATTRDSRAGSEPLGNKEREELQSIVDLYRSHCNSISVLRLILRCFDPRLYRDDGNLMSILD